MNIHPSEFPILVPIDDEGIEHQPPPRIINPRPVTACVVTKRCKPLEAECLDLSQDKDCMTLAAMTESVHSDQLSMIIWPQNTESPLSIVYELLSRMITRDAITPLPDSLFMQTWLRDAKIALTDYEDLTELVLAKQAHYNKAEDYEDDDP